VKELIISCRGRAHYLVLVVVDALLLLIRPPLQHSDLSLLAQLYWMTYWLYLLIALALASVGVGYGHATMGFGVRVDISAAAAAAISWA
jgi:hypothetical protein